MRNTDQIKVQEQTSHHQFFPDSTSLFDSQVLYLPTPSGAVGWEMGIVLSL